MLEISTQIINLSTDNVQQQWKYPTTVRIKLNLDTNSRFVSTSSSYLFINIILVRFEMQHSSSMTTIFKVIFFAIISTQTLFLSRPWWDMLMCPCDTWSSLSTDDTFTDFIITVPILSPAASGSQQTQCELKRNVDWLGFNGTFSTNRLNCAFEKYVEKIEINVKVQNVTYWKYVNTYLKYVN